MSNPIFTDLGLDGIDFFFSLLIENLKIYRKKKELLIQLNKNKCITIPLKTGVIAIIKKLFKV